MATVLLCLGAWGTVARAQTAPGVMICLDWQDNGDAGCPSREDLTAAVGDTLDRRVTRPGICDLRVRGAFRRDASGGWGAELSFTSVKGEDLGRRSLEVRDAPCAALKEPVALVIALMAEAQSSEPAALRVSPRAPVAAAKNMTTVSFGSAFSSGLTADAGWGVTAGVGSRRLAGVPLRLDTSFWFPAQNGDPGPAGEFWAWLGGAGICPRLLQWRRLAVGACARVVGGLIRGVGRGLDQIESATRPLAAASLGGQLALRLSRHASIYVGMGALVPWARARFVYQDVAGNAVVVHQPGLVIPLAEVGIELGAGEDRGGSE